MSQQRLPMRKVRDVLRLKAVGLGKRKIAASLGISATAVGGCLRRAREGGVAWPLAVVTSEPMVTAQTIASALALISPFFIRDLMVRRSSGRTKTIIPAR